MDTMAWFMQYIWHKKMKAVQRTESCGWERNPVFFPNEAVSPVGKSRSLFCPVTELKVSPQIR